MDFVWGIVAIILAIIILSMRNSEKKWIAFIGWLLFILAKIYRN
ncbi:hypothetical protein [Clostridium sp. Cult1]|nr:hypothetical protein [Clostridium sp. Cult1]